MSIPPADPHDPMRLVRDLQAHAERLQQQSRQITEAMAAASVTLANSHVELTVAPGGAVESLRFLPGATSAAQTQVAASVKELYLSAEAEAATRTSRALSGVGLAEAVTRSLPDDVTTRQQENNR